MSDRCVTRGAGMLRQWRVLGVAAVVAAASVQVQTIRGAAPVGIQQSGGPAVAAVSRLGVPDRALLDRYCISCHSERLRTGGLVLENLDLAQAGANAEVLEKVLLKIRAGQMPPPGRPQPAATDASA